MTRSLRALIIAGLVAASMAGLHCAMGPTENGLRGTWHWQRSVGGFAGWTLTPASEGYTQRLRLGPGADFAFYRADTLAARGTFSIVQEGERALIRYQTESDWWLLSFGHTIARRTPDTLVLRDRCTDCYTHTFTRP